MIECTIHALNTHKKAMNGRCWWIGLAYEPDVDDIRESQTFKIVDLLKTKGAETAYYDLFILEILETREHGEYIGMQTVEWNKEPVSGFDTVVISTNDSTIDYAELAAWSECLVDKRNAMKGIQEKDNKHIL